MRNAQGCLFSNVFVYTGNCFKHVTSKALEIINFRPVRYSEMKNITTLAATKLRLNVGKPIC